MPNQSNPNIDIAGDVTTSAVIALGETVSSDLTDEGDQDWFAITLAEGQTIRVAQTAPAGTTLQLVNAAGVTLAAAPTFRSLQSDEDFFFTADDAGTYYLNMASRTEPRTGTFGEGEYAVTVTEFFDDFGDTAETAQTLTGPFTVNGAIEDTGDTDAFNIGLAANEILQISAARDFNGTDTLNSFQIDILNDAGARLAFFTYTSGAGNFEYEAPESGQYTLLIDGFRVNPVTTVNSYGEYILSGAILPAVTIIEGHAGDNRLVGTAGRGRISGLGGDDKLIGLADNDELLGGNGHDRLLGGGGDDSLFGDTGNDTIFAGAGAAYGGDGQDFLYGQDGDDRVQGGDGNDRMWGGRGDDIMLGQDGADIVYGNAGDDRLIGGDGNDKLFGGIGDDLLNGNLGDDFISGGSGEDRLEGGDGDDRLYGNNDDDIIDGENGNDRMLVGSGDDIILGNNGDDYGNGGNGNDQVLLGLGNDTGFGGAGDDLIAGSDGFDTLYGGAGNDNMSGGSDNDVLYGNSGDDVLTGNDGYDDLYGGLGNDRLEGGNGDDWLFGQTDTDVLLGGFANDLIVGGRGDDTLYGNDGSDTFRFISGDGVDTVKDFEAGTDLIDMGRTNMDSFAELLSQSTQDGSNFIINYGAHDQLILENIDAGMLTADDFAF